MTLIYRYGSDSGTVRRIWLRVGWVPGPDVAHKLADSETQIQPFKKGFLL